jgi:AcrR family transcriptional regulator
MSPQARKTTQRDRLLNGMVTVALRRGYAGANVSEVIGEAGVSRPTFYDYFKDRDDCFRAAIADVHTELVALLADDLAADGVASSHHRAVRTLVEFSVAEPARARFLMGEAMAGGTGALAERDRGIAELAAAIEDDSRRKRERAPADLDARVLIGSVYRMIATRLRRAEVGGGKLAEELVAWVASYQRPRSQRRWKELRAKRVPSSSPGAPPRATQQMPGVLPPGRPWAAPGEVAENHRLRILFAAATLAQEKGTIATTVADITRLARLDGRAFYRLFADKQEAFVAVHAMGFQQVMDVTAKAFFSAEEWPQRSWEGTRALTELLQTSPIIAHMGFVEAYSVGPAAVQRIEDSHAAFLFFLQEGLMQNRDSQMPTRVAMEAIIAAVFEIIYIAVRRRGKPQIVGLLPYIVHVWLTPFLGLERADEFIEGQLAGKPRKRKAPPCAERDDVAG